MDLPGGRDVLSSITALKEQPLAGLANDWTGPGMPEMIPSVKWSDLVVWPRMCTKPWGNILNNKSGADRLQSAKRRTKNRLTVSDNGFKGVEYEADYALCLLPLGVLKAASAGMFVPPLHLQSSSVLDRAEVGVLDTVVVQWNRRCQPDVTAYYLMGGPAIKKRQ
jgi:hypothetical protein